MEELIRSLTSFGAAPHENFVQWLQDMEVIFDQVQLQPPNKFIVAQSYLTKTAALWFRFNKSNILDWHTFQCEIIKAFQPSFNQKLINIEKQQPSSFFSSNLHDQHQSTYEDKIPRIKQEQDAPHVFVSTSSKISSTATVLQKEKENETNKVDLINDKPLKSFEDLEDESPRKHEQSYYSPILADIIDPDIKIQLQCVEVVDDCDELQQEDANIANAGDKLEQPDEAVIKSDVVQPDVEDVFETVAESISDVTTENSVIHTVVPMAVQYLRSDKRRLRKRSIFKRVHTAYEWDQYNKNYGRNHPLPTAIQRCQSNIFYPIMIAKILTPSFSFPVCRDHEDFSMLQFPATPPYEDITFKTVNKEWNYLCQDISQCHFQSGIHKLSFRFHRWKYRKWKRRKWKYRKWKRRKWKYCKWKRRKWKYRKWKRRKWKYR